VGERGPLATPGAAAHRPTLDRVNAINESFNKKLKKNITLFPRQHHTDPFRICHRREGTQVLFVLVAPAARSSMWLPSVHSTTAWSSTLIDTAPLPSRFPFIHRHFVSSSPISRSIFAIWRWTATSRSPRCLSPLPGQSLRIQPSTVFPLNRYARKQILPPLLNSVSPVTTIADRLATCHFHGC